jgi:glycosyltransferase involved in cell wall biosynthesis
MTFTIISHVVHKRNKQGQIGGYAPNVREMNLWIKHVDKVVDVSPVEECEFDAIDIAYHHDTIEFIETPIFNLTSLTNIFKTILTLPLLFGKVYRGMAKADHIHLRCPGNQGLIGSFVQILFPSKAKTAKYAGNWDFESKQPWSYRWQQKLLRNTVITKNMQVLVYGNWPDKNKNIKPFFTATYSESEILETPIRTFEKDRPIKLIYVGSLVPGKQPLASAEVCKQLVAKGIKIELHFYGEGPERKALTEYISSNTLEESVFLHGNVNKDDLINAWRESHFLVFISKSEGWPKAVAESMFWGCLPLTTKVSCVPEMVGNGSRGDLVNPSPKEIAGLIENYILNAEVYAKKCREAMNWSQQYTLEKFEKEILGLLK